MSWKISLAWMENGTGSGVYRPPGPVPCLCSEPTTAVAPRYSHQVLLPDAGVVVLVPVLKGRASMKFRHDTSYLDQFCGHGPRHPLRSQTLVAP